MLEDDVTLASEMASFSDVTVSVISMSPLMFGSSSLRGGERGIASEKSIGSGLPREEPDEDSMSRRLVGFAVGALSLS